MKGSVDNMKFEQLVELIQTVSSSNLGEFKYEEGDFKISLKKEKGEVRLAEQSESVPARASEQPQDSSEKKSGNVIKSPLVGTFYASRQRMQIRLYRWESRYRKERFWQSWKQ